MGYCTVVYVGGGSAADRLFREDNRLVLRFGMCSGTFPRMTRADVLHLTSEELREACARSTAYSEVLRASKYLALASVWPLWEAACKQEPSWALSARDGGCVIFAVEDCGTRIIVPSGRPADAIRRAFLMATFSE